MVEEERKSGIPRRGKREPIEGAIAIALLSVIDLNNKKKNH